MIQTCEPSGISVDEEAAKKWLEYRSSADRGCRKDF